VDPESIRHYKIDKEIVNMNKFTTKNICLTALGVALYVAMSMVIKIPVIGHISLDLGYIVFAVYCYIYGAASGAIVGACGCFLVSILATGWLGTEWAMGNLLIGVICGIVYKRIKDHRYEIIIGIVTTVIAVFLGICIVKTALACAVYGYPFAVKFAKNSIAFVMDSIVMSIGFLFAKRIQKYLGDDNHGYTEKDNRRA